LKRGSPASERGDCSSKNEGARGIRSAGVTTAATCWAVTCERQWPLWHGNCCSGVSGREPWSRFITTEVASALVKPRLHPAQWISETSKPSVSNRTNGRRPSRLPVLAPARVSVTCIILPVNALSRRFRGPVYQTTWSGAREQVESESASTRTVACWMPNLPHPIRPKVGSALAESLLLMTTCAFSILLDWGTRHRTVGTKNTAVARERLEPFAAALAVVEELAGVARHRLNRLMIALRTGERRFQLHWLFARTILSRGRSSVSQFAAVTTSKGGKNNRGASVHKLYCGPTDP
jgi:hypothetical protein